MGDINSLIIDTVVALTGNALSRYHPTHNEIKNPRNCVDFMVLVSPHEIQ